MKSAVKEPPELFHYTTFEGLKGIIETRTIRATHYSNLNDAAEINYLKEALHAPVFEMVFQKLRAKARRKPVSTQRELRRLGGLKAAAGEYAAAVVSIIYDAIFEETAFPKLKRPPLISPYIASFCSHDSDEEYERSNGLLSQWRAYGGTGGFCIVFAATQLAELLSRERDQYVWPYLDMSPVTYSNDQTGVEHLIRDIVVSSELLAEQLINNKPHPNLSHLFFKTLIAATHLKHRGFREEREVRIVACPANRAQIDATRKDIKDVIARLQFKAIHESASPLRKRYIALFDQLRTALPIRRVIVGPSVNQDGNLLIAKDLLGSGTRLYRSETPFIGHG